MKITKLHSRWILDSRGLPTVEVEATSDSGQVAIASVPSGASTGSHEALELRDDDSQHFEGKGVLKALDHIQKEIAPKLVGQHYSQAEIDKLLCDLGGEGKSKLGANATLAVSLACLKLAALDEKVDLYRYVAQLADTKQLSLPMPMFNILNGGKHAPDASDIQEYMIMPIGATSMQMALEMGSEIFYSLKSLLHENHFSISVGDEGGFAPAISNPEQTLDLLIRSIDQAGFKPGKDVSLCLDVAASELFDGVNYKFNKQDISKSSAEMIDWLKGLVANYPIVSIEDGLNEDDWTNWIDLTKNLGDKVQIVGDDLFVTDKRLLEKGVEMKAANAILIKPNQIGTVSETISCVKTAQSNGWNTILSHRSGETEDVSIAHLAVGLNCGQIKAGSLSRTDRVEKYNELLRIAELQPDLKLAHSLVMSD